MTETAELSVPEAAARLGRSERTIWRQIRSGELQTKREGRRVLVLIPDRPWGSEAAGGHRTSESAATYDRSRYREAGQDWQARPFPYTPAVARLLKRSNALRRCRHPIRMG